MRWASTLGCVFLLASCVRAGFGVSPDGALADGSTTSDVASDDAQAGPGLLPPNRIAAGAGHACFVHATGTVSCWGWNQDGQLGDGTMQDSPLPLAVPNVDNIVEVGLGREFSCARRNDGRVLCWGLNNVGQLGDGSFTNRLDPAPASGLEDATDLDCGRWHCCALRASGRVACWGDNRRYQLGDGTLDNRPLPQEVGGVDQAIQVSAGAFHSCALHQYGRVSCWGQNSSGQIGDGTTDDHPTAIDVPLPFVALEIKAGRSSSCARSTTGELACWGANADGQIGDGTTTSRRSPTAVVGLSNAVQIGGYGWQFNCARRANGRVACWGTNDRGQLGDGSTELFRPLPGDVALIDDAVFLALNHYGGYVLRGSGEVWAWGHNDSGQIGDGTTEGRPLPVRVLLP